MNKFFCFLSILFLSFLPLNVSAADFIDGFEDIPLMKGLRQIENQNFSFGNEESGYTEAILISSQNKNFEDVKNFYHRILPQFGWKLTNESSKHLNFTRENDVLEIFRQQNKPLKVLVSLKSKN